MKEEVQKYFDGLARSLMFEGAKAKLLYPAIVSPKEHFDLQITMISIATAIPRRFLTGAEAAKLASQQDSINWMDRVMNRREVFIGPKVVSRLFSVVLRRVCCQSRKVTGHRLMCCGLKHNLWLSTNVQMPLAT
jgi:hypothetical protein